MSTTTIPTVPSLPPEQEVRKWFAVVTVPQHEKAASRHLDNHGIETFLPTYASTRTWKNRQTVELELPLFPTYLFVRIDQHERTRVLRTPGVRQLVGNSREPLSVADLEIDFLRKSLAGQKVEPHTGMIEGQRVRVRSGPMAGIEGWLVRKASEWRFVLLVQLIHQQVAMEVDASALEPLVQ